MGQSLKIVLCGTGGTGVTGVTGAACCRQDGKGSIDKNPGVSGAEVHPNSDGVGPELVPELLELDICELRGTAGGGLSFLSCSHDITLCPVCDLSVCVAVGKTKIICTVYLQLRSGICLCVQQSSGKAYLLLLFQYIPVSLYLNVRCINYNQEVKSKPVWLSAQWETKNKTLNLYVLFCLFFFSFIC